jgi:citrate synthase
MPQIAATIYRKHFHKDMKMPKKPDMDWAGGFGQMLGVSNDPNFLEVLRLYLFLHADHEGGNVSAHTTHCVGSSLADPFLSWSAGLCGLAGPLHGLANQEALRWLSACREALGSQPITEERVMAFAEETLKAGKVIPGFGHAVLRKTDPRYMLQREFALKHMKDDPLFQLVDKCFTGIPKVLGKTGKVANPFPNVDAHSGQCLTYYNLHESDFYTVVFAVSRSLGVMSQLVNSRLLGLPIERPKSLNLSALEKL